MNTYRKAEIWHSEIEFDSKKPVSEESGMAFTDEEKEHAKKLLDDYFKAVAEGTPFTAIFTTDGVRRLMFTSGYTLPNRYLEPWEDDQKSDVDLSLDFSGMEEKIRHWPPDSQY